MESNVTEHSHTHILKEKKKEEVRDCHLSPRLLISVRNEDEGGIVEIKRAGHIRDPFHR